jgi:hypothetical protein
MVAIVQSSHLERWVMHRTSAKVNKTDPASHAEVRKSSAAVSTAIPTISATKGVRFILTVTVMIIRLSRRAFLGMAATGAASTETDILPAPLDG